MEKQRQNNRHWWWFCRITIAKNLMAIEKKIMVMIEKSNHHMFSTIILSSSCGRIEPLIFGFCLERFFQRSKNIQFRMTK